MTLVVPPLHVSTPAVYRAWDELGGPTAVGPNDLEPAAIAVEPQLVVWRDRIAELSGTTPMLAGSGATWFVEGRRDDALGALSGEGATWWCAGRPRRAPDGYLRRWWRVRRSIFLCFFFRIRLRRFLINEPIGSATLPPRPVRPALPLLPGLGGAQKSRLGGAQESRRRSGVVQSVGHRVLVPRIGVRFLSPEHDAQCRVIRLATR